MVALAERILARVEPDTNGGCWLWTGCGSRTDGTGYGSISHGGRRDGAHRASYRAFVGDIPEGLIVCHRCDVPACVNPAHLFVGTYKDNAADRDRKGRKADNPLREEQVYTAKLSARDIPAIRASEDPVAVTAERYGVSTSAITDVRTGKSWRHVQ